MSETVNGNGREEVIPIKVNRVFDSCCDKDCLTGVTVQLAPGALPASITLVKTKCVSISDVCISVEAIPFNRGFYAIDLTYTFDVELLAYEKACDTGIPVSGTACATKSVILYGSESSTQIFTSSGEVTGETNACCNTFSLPDATVQVATPIALETKISSGCRCCNSSAEELAQPTRRTVVLTLGLFSVVELSRPVTVMVPTYSYTVPRKSCPTTTDSPCDIFSRIEFPTEAFSPLTLDDVSDCGCGCGCGCDS